MFSCPSVSLFLSCHESLYHQEKGQKKISNMATNEETFRAYTQKQGELYAADRPGYSPALFKFIIDHHKSTGGELVTFVDVGCGTGQATCDLAQYFSEAIGLDPSEGMIGIARALLNRRSRPCNLMYRLLKTLALI